MLEPASIRSLPQDGEIGARWTRIGRSSVACGGRRGSDGVSSKRLSVLLPAQGEAASATGRRVPRVSRLMALAIRFDQLIRDGVVSGQAELARLGHVMRARLTQIMNLLCLAPEIQEALLFLPVTERGRDVVTEKQVRPIVALADWTKQRQSWRATRNTSSCD